MKMDDEFTISRVKKRLSIYHDTIEGIAEEFENATYDRKEELMIAIGDTCKELMGEKERVNKNNTAELNCEAATYLPALEEACMHLEQALNPESNQNVLGCLHDASFSLGYYLNHG